MAASREPARINVIILFDIVWGHLKIGSLPLIEYIVPRETFQDFLKEVRNDI